MATNEPPRPNQPDVNYYPDFVKYQKRTERRLQNEDLESVLQLGLPQKIDCAAAWDRSIEERPESWLYYLDAEDVEEIDQALARFQCMRAGG